MTTSTTTTADIAIITIPFSQFDEFKKLANKFQKKQAKYELPIGSYTVMGIILENGINSLKIQLNDFGTVIKKQDADEYVFIGIQYVEKGIQRNYIENPGYREHFTTFPTTCDHCKINRFRTNYYIFEHNEDKVSIGTTCVQDYFGIYAVEALEFRRKVALLKDNVTNDRTASISDLAFIIDKYIRNFDWKTLKNNADFQQDVEDVFNGKINGSIANVQTKLQETFKGDNSDFAKHCFDVLAKPYVSYHERILALAAIYYGYKNLSKPTTKTTSAYNIGDKITADVKVLFTKEYTNYYGYNASTSTFIKMLDKTTGEILTTYSTILCPKVGDEFTITGTVKEKATYKGNESWTLTRCKR